MKPGDTVWVRRGTMVYSGTFSDSEGDCIVVVATYPPNEAIQVVYSAEVFPTKQEAIDDLYYRMTESARYNRNIRLLVGRIK